MIVIKVFTLCSIMFFCHFKGNMLHPSSGCLNLVEVGTETLGEGIVLIV